MYFRRGFTLIELLVAIALTAILAGLVSVSYSNARRTSRDGTRRTDAYTYAAALENYGLINGGSYFVQLTKACPTPITPPSNSEILNSSSYVDNCVGAIALSVGRMNFRGGTETDLSSGFVDQYTAKYTISEGLKSLGFLSSINFDPLAKADPTIAGQPDFIFLRCTASGAQANFGSKTDGVAAVWVRLESSPTDIEKRNAAKTCGGTGSPYTYSSNANLSTQSNWFAALVGGTL
jgi:prepilin-type N-terminal cleavage/methylation domain-containing protein